MAGKEQLCYDLGYAGIRPDRPSRGPPSLLQNNVTSFVQQSLDNGVSAENMAWKWLQDNSHRFEIAADGLLSLETDSLR